MTDKGLGQVFHLSFRCICLMATMFILISIVGYAFVAIQSIWTGNLRSEVDRLSRTNDLLEDNNDRFKQCNQELQVQVGRLQNDVHALNESLSEFSALNSQLQGNIENINSSKIELEDTVDDFTDQRAQLQEQVDDFTNKTSDLEDIVAELNQTSQRLEEELQVFKQMEQNIANFAVNQKGSFESILNSTQVMIDELSRSTIAQLQATLSTMANSLEYKDGNAGFNRDEYTELLTRFAFVLTETADQLLEENPFKPPLMSYKPQVKQVVIAIVEREAEQLSQSSAGTTKGWFLESDSDEEVGDFIFNLNRKMLYVI